MFPITLRTFKVKVALLFATVLFISLDDVSGGHKDDDDDDYDDDDPDCYPGRNCIPGCYCGAEKECRPYFPPKSHQHGQWKCRPFNYPKWKVPVSKHRKKNIKQIPIRIIMGHHPYDKIENYKDITSLFTQSNITASDQLALALSTAKFRIKNANHTAVLNEKETSIMLLEFVPSYSKTPSKRKPLLPTATSPSASATFFERLYS